MTERGLRPELRRSIFVKVLAVMLATAVILILTVSLFFSLLFKPSLETNRRLVQEYARALAATSPDLETARALSRRLDLQLRYEGPRGAWTTDPDLPTAAGVPSHARRHEIYLAPAPDGGTYLLSWRLGRRMRAAHDQFVAWVLLLVAGVVFSAYVVLNRSLVPLRSLHEGVRRLSEGELDVVVPSRTRDEFGMLTEAFNQMVHRIAGMVRARDQLLLDVSHELRSPLTRMKVALALLPESEKRRQIAADVAEMEAMITELLELERLRDGRSMRRQQQDLLPLLHAVAQTFQDRPPGLCIAAAGPIPLNLDADPMRTVLRNLLDNAVKYSLPDSRPIEVAVEERDEAVLLRVIDDGPGIPPADLDHLFEPFFRVDRSRSKKTGGYGLGLSICRRILEAHGGGITAENNPGRGATFTLTLPKAD